MYDLHVHSNASDALRWSQGQIVLRAVALGVRVVGITDHDTISGVENAIRAAEHVSAADSKVLVVPGVEITSKYYDKVTGPEGMEIHVLAYGKSLLNHLGEVEDKLASTRAARRERVDRIWAVYREVHGVVAREEESLTHSATVTRESLRQRISDQELRRRFMEESSWGCIAYVPYTEGALMSTEQVLDEFRPYCDCMILAHPGRLIDAYLLRLKDLFLPSLADEAGIEYSTARLNTVEDALRTRAQEDPEFNKKLTLVLQRVFLDTSKTGEQTLYTLVRDHNLDGLEVFYSDHSDNATRRLNHYVSRLRQKFPNRKVLRTLGSDFGHKDKELGRGKDDNLLEHQSLEDCKAFLEVVGLKL